MINASVAATLGPMRAPFLLLVPVCVAVGVSTAIYDGHSVNALDLLLVFLGALAAHISVNVLNEYEDFRSGLDFQTKRTPFSGGSGTLPAIPDKAHYALVTGVVSLLVVMAIGLYFVWNRGWGILPLGLAGVLLIVFYTRWITRSPLLCLFAPGLGFGPLMILGVHYALSGEYSQAAVAASLLPMFLVSNLLLMNQFPDWEADRQAGRNHLLIAWGNKAGVMVYGGFLLAAYLSVLVAVSQGVLPAYTALSWLTLVLAIPVYLGLRRNYTSVPALIPYMGRNVVLSLLTPLLLAVGIYLG